MKRSPFILLLTGAVVWFAACSSGGSGKGSPDNGINDHGQGQDIIFNHDAHPVQDLQHNDTHADSHLDLQKDTHAQGEDLQQGDPGQMTPFQVKSTSPANEQTNVGVPFKVTIKFNRAVRGQSVISSNFYLKGPNGKPVSVTYDQPAKDTITLTPAKATDYKPASPYTVVLTNNIMDENGYRLKDKYQFTFYTGIPGGTTRYKALAAKYSPIIYQAVDPSEPKADYLTRIDFDKDWDASNNWLNLQKASSVPSDVYYDCIETPSHYFIYYMYYHALYNSGTKEYKHGNDMEGAIVVVAKYPKEHPIAVETYFQPGQSTEEILSFVTNESGIVPSGKDKNKYSVDQVFSQDQLFPAGHFLAYVTSKLDSGKAHESCLWILDQPSAPYCKLSKQIKSGLKTIKYVYSDGKEQQVKSGTVSQESVSYGLRYLVDDLWTRRLKDGKNGLFSGTFQYWINDAPDQGNQDKRPGYGLMLPKRFVDSVNEGTSTIKGKPPWSWGWNHEFSTNPNLRIYAIPRGMVLLDPAYYFVKRHDIKTAYNPQDKTGFSLDYCFNPYLNIDNRGKNTDCPK